MTNVLRKVDLMKARADLFQILALFTFIITIALNVGLYLVTDNANTPYLAEIFAGTAAMLTGMCVVTCGGFGLTVIFALLAWRNNVGVRAEDRHAEMLENLHRRRKDANLPIQPYE